MSFLGEKETILFQGDSITDAGRNYSDPNSFGFGYPLFVSAILQSVCLENDFMFINRGVSGNRAKDLESRWSEDCIKLAPTVVSILIGINDTWRAFDNNDPTSSETFYESYHKILTRTKNELDAKIVLMEPFVLPVNENMHNWRADLDPKIAAVRKLACEFNAVYVPLDGLFAAVSTRKPATFWAHDGVHPTNAGHALIADAWIDAVK